MAVKKVVKRRKDIKHIDKGCVHIHSTFNNTIITFTDMQGNVVSWSSGGKLGLKGTRQGTPFAAQMICEDAGKVAKDMGMRTVEVYVKGSGQGRESAIRALAGLDFEVTLIQDVSPIPHNGCRPPKRRRI